MSESVEQNMGAAYGQLPDASASVRSSVLDVLARRRGRLAVAATVITAAWVCVYLWATIPHRWQGRVVLTLGYRRGLHSSDIPTVLGAALVTIVALRWASSRR